MRVMAKVSKQTASWDLSYVIEDILRDALLKKLRKKYKINFSLYEYDSLLDDSVYLTAKMTFPKDIVLTSEEVSNGADVEHAVLLYIQKKLKKDWKGLSDLEMEQIILPNLAVDKKTQSKIKKLETKQNKLPKIKKVLKYTGGKRIKKRRLDPKVRKSLREYKELQKSIDILKSKGTGKVLYDTGLIYFNIRYKYPLENIVKKALIESIKKIK